MLLKRHLIIFYKYIQRNRIHIYYLKQFTNVKKSMRRYFHYTQGMRENNKSCVISYKVFVFNSLKSRYTQQEIRGSYWCHACYNCIYIYATNACGMLSFLERHVVLGQVLDISPSIGLRNIKIQWWKGKLLD